MTRDGRGEPPPTSGHLGVGEPSLRLRERSPKPGADYSGAIYGSLLAASVVVGAGSFGVVSAGELAILLLATGLVFWVAHVYAALLGGKQDHPLRSPREIRQACLEEWPLVQAAVPPAAVAFSCWLFDGIDSTAAWLTLATAVTEQVGWAGAAARQLGYGWRTTVSAAVVNLLLGLVIVGLKTALH